MQAQQSRAQSRRQHQRAANDSVFTTTTRDLSEGGAGLTSDRPLEEGTEIVLGLFLVLDDVESDTPPLWVKGRVAWCAEGDDDRYNAGVRFEVITDEQRAWLRQVLNEIAPPPAAPASPPRSGQPPAPRRGPR
jgi:Tfp pilus assembly protein PilZ